jgi:hypothetical protein
LPTGIDNSIKNFLPRTYLHYAEDLTDDVKSKESATFGKKLLEFNKFRKFHSFEKITESFNDL